MTYGGTRNVEILLRIALVTLIVLFVQVCQEDEVQEAASIVETQTQ